LLSKNCRNFSRISLPVTVAPIRDVESAIIAEHGGAPQ
jgi:hypothetical protein